MSGDPETNDGGPAFPLPHTGNVHRHDGMTLRDWFAGQAMSSMIATFTTNANFGAIQAYRYADAMLKAREDALIAKAEGSA